MIELAILFHPQIFIDAGIFINDSKLLPDGSANKFFKITDETIGVHVNQQVMIGGKTVRVLNVMVYNSSWLLRNYFNPLKEISREKNPGQTYSPIATEASNISGASSVIVNQPIEFRIKPVSLICKYCKHPITTKTKDSINCLACCCFLFFSLLYICIQVLNDKNPCCCDVSHYCPNCGRFLGKYTTC